MRNEGRNCFLLQFFPMLLLNLFVVQKLGFACCGECNVIRIIINYLNTLDYKQNFTAVFRNSLCFLPFGQKQMINNLVGHPTQETKSGVNKTLKVSPWEKVILMIRRARSW